MSLFTVSVSDPEKACDFADFRAYRGGIHAEALKPEGKFGNTGIGDDLRFGILHDIADAAGGFTVGERGKRSAVKQNFAVKFTVRRELRLDEPHERGFAASAVAAEKYEVALVYGEGDVFERRRGIAGICEIQRG